MKDWLWLVWAGISLGGFAGLEIWALLDGPLRPLTFWLRLGVQNFGWLVVTILGGFISWILFHLFIEPLQRKTRRQKDR